jgi:hypothetical protein
MFHSRTQIYVISYRGQARVQYNWSLLRELIVCNFVILSVFLKHNYLCKIASSYSGGYEELCL